ncbi:MFS transporter [Methylobacterium aerolatum]|uniref:PPP family 3-phenylpropionic acid transporter n=1 Tax=Methylobacterium aerolatum TaxID=418708 RepID=A0ABU0I2A1_9HYPH|nr:MFS transporter [Methylobacterium aerolatum]MDQ0448732.1 PPP family 3-phenylpropionic acid transporter [Methylobacterium aerolatum]GJD34944.1 putative 3-phenylpropionic acid transporter [Methylobacterium aerolatum]
METTTPRRRVLSGSFPAFVLLQGALYAAYGTVSPFLPSFLGERGLSPGEIGIALAAGTLMRIAAGPITGHVADRYAATRGVLGIAAAASGLIAFAYLAGVGFWPMLVVSVLHAGATAALAPLADALALAAAEREGTFSYGWVRGAGSAAFVLGTLVSGLLIGWAGLASIVVSCGLLFLLTAAATACVPRAPARTGLPSLGFGGLRELLALAPFRRMSVVAALIIGSHALNDGFAVIRWREAGIGPGAISLLWSEAVASEVVVFVLVGPWLLARLGTARAAMLAAGMGVLRWSVMATTVSVPVLAMVQPTHGFTFALLHLTAMHLFAGVVPERLAASAQTLYGNLGLGVASAALTAMGGLLYGAFGAGAFWVMAALCALALPFARRLHAKPVLR